MNALEPVLADTGAFVQIADVSVAFPVKTGAFTKGFVRAVQQVSLEVHPGQILGIVGESGCGKSTLAKVLIGLQEPQSGSLLIDGEDIYRCPVQERHSTVARNLAMVFQDPASSLNPRLSAERIIRDPLDVHGVGDERSRHARVEELMSLVGLPDSIAPRLPREMSGGQQQRVAIARALALQPRIIVADEPTSALDVSVRSQIINLLVDLKQRLGLGMVFISHDIHTVRYLADRLAVMYLGRVVEQGTTSLVADNPRHPYTQALLSASLSIGGAEHERIVLKGNVPSPRRPPSGCPFHTRCWLATDSCHEALPAEISEPERQFTCHHPLPEQ